MTVEKSSTTTSVTAAGQVITYSYLVTNTGNVTLTGISLVDDNVDAQPACIATTLVPGATTTCTAQYTVLQSDINAGGNISNNVTASSNESGDATDDLDIPIAQDAMMTITKDITSGSTYAAVGDVVSYSYTITNSGNVMLAGPFTVVDDVIGTLTDCAAGPLAPGESVTCTATYTIVQADLDRGYVTNYAYATDGTTTSEPDEETATINNLPPSITCPTMPAIIPCSQEVSGLAAIISDPNNNIESLTWTMAGATEASSPAKGINNLDTYTFQWGTTTVTYTVTDAQGLTESCSFTVTIEADGEFTMPPNTSEIVNCPGDIKEPEPPEVRDGCGNLIIPVAGKTPVAPVCEGEMVYRWMYTDKDGNSYTWTHTVTIIYKPFGPITATFSTVACVKDIWDGIIPPLPVVTDNCGNVLTPTGPVKSSLPECEGTKTWTWTYTDCVGNKQEYVHTVIVEMPPLAPITPTYGTVQCVDHIWDGIVPRLPIVTDGCGNVLVPTGPVKSSLPKCSGKKTWTWTYTDCTGQSQQYVHTVEVILPPFKEIKPTSATFECAKDIKMPVMPNVTDYCGNVLSPVGPVITMLDDCQGSRKYTWTYSDCSGNTRDYVHTVTLKSLKPLAPITPTFFAVPCVKYIGDYLVPPLPVVTDACGNVLIPTGPVKSALPVCEGRKTWTWTYTDCAGNSQKYVHTVTVEMEPFEEITPTSAVFACKDDIVLPELPVVKDNCGNILTPTGPVSIPVEGCSGSQKFVWTYKDCEGNSRDYVHTVIIKPPVFDEIAPTFETVSCPDRIIQPTPPVVKDYCGNILVPTGPVRSALPQCEGSKTFTWTYTDCAGNKRDYVHTVTVDYKPFPAIPSTSATVDAAMDIVMPVLPVVKDNCGNTIVPIGPSISPMPSCEGVVIYTWTYADCSGYSQDYVHVVTIKGCVTLNHCTYTQGFYGNQNGKNCFFNGVTYISTDALSMMKAAFGDMPFVMFGTETNGKYFKLMKESLSDDLTPSGIFQMLPGGGTPAPLIGSATSLDEMSRWGNVPRSVQAGSLGKIKNNLLSQTITLFFNLGNNMELGEIRLRGPYMITEKSIECGSLISVPNSGLYTEIPQSVLDYFTANNLDGTINDLYDLANLVLGGETIIPAVFPGDITAAVDAINTGFDECRILVRFASTKPDVPKATSETYEIGKSNNEGLSADLTEVALTVYPNPFRTTVKFQLDMIADSRVKVEIYSMNGQLLKIIFNEALKQGDVRTTEFDAAMYAHSAFLYKVVTDHTIKSGTVMKIR